jgi:hypothetical protein
VKFTYLTWYWEKLHELNNEKKELVGKIDNIISRPICVCENNLIEKEVFK